MSIYYAITQKKEDRSIQIFHSKSRIRKKFDNVFDDIRRLYEGGLTLALDTDTMGIPLAFGKNALELELYVEKVV